MRRFCKHLLGTSLRLCGLLHPFEVLECQGRKKKKKKKKNECQGSKKPCDRINMGWDTMNNSNFIFLIGLRFHVLKTEKKTSSNDPRV